MATPIGWDPSVYNDTTTGNFLLGQELEYQGKTYRWLKLVTHVGAADNVAGVSGMVCEAASATDPNIVTLDRAGGSSLGRIPVAALIGTVSVDRYFFGLVRGIHAGIKDAAGACTTVGRKVVPHATTDGDVTDAAATITRDINCIGTVRVATAAGVVGVYIKPEI